jgi:drug/metabolite transporter (DMT)-like permease
MAIAPGLLLAVVLWGGNNTGTKLLVASWPPVFTGATRFFSAGMILLAVLRWTKWLGIAHQPSRDLARALWIRGGLSLAIYIVAFNLAVIYISPSHVALYLGAAPVWALLWEGFRDRSQLTTRRLVAAVLALCGVFVLLWPALRTTSVKLWGEVFGLIAGILWANYGLQCRILGKALSGAEVSAQTMWRAGVLLAPIALGEVLREVPVMNPKLVSIQLYCVLAGGVVAFAIWNNALRVWPTSQVLLFNNLIPLSTMTWSHFWIGETVTPTFWLAMILIAAGVVLGQINVRSTMQTSIAQLE